MAPSLDYSRFPSHLSKLSELVCTRFGVGSLIFLIGGVISGIIFYKPFNAKISNYEKSSDLQGIHYSLHISSTITEPFRIIMSFSCWPLQYGHNGVM